MAERALETLKVALFVDWLLGGGMAAIGPPGALS